MSSVVFEKVTKQYENGFTAVKDLNINLEDKEFLVLVGPSGCGKTTSLRMLAGLEDISDGSIYIDGQRVNNVTPKDRDIAMVFQSYALYPHMSVADNMGFSLDLKGVPKKEIKKRVQEAGRQLGIEQLLDRKPKQLSGGQRQRVALARCLAGGANIILMDEPLANLDPHLRGTMEGELLAFHRESGATTLYITHDQREAMALADQLAVMEEGRFLQVGPPDEIYDRPGNATVARFIGQGALQPVMVRGGRAQIGKSSFATEAADGPGQALFRPSDLDLTDPSGEALTGIVSSTTYRGGAWEAIVTVDGLSEPFEVTSRVRLNVGEPVGLRILRGWVLPG